ncbi:auxin efflux carrier [Dichotomopilus funicola]|uniref:Auxin efflux carrier n=1 Tax=Dichotomopilus funicola TaxID=1934379 RepID=A0AAN6V587_9PEZI|nr:auxin efflux carrier [Dichotomopilus funicola]
MGLLDFRAPTSLRLALGDAWDPTTMTAGPSRFVVFQNTPSESHPSLDHLMLLVFGAVLEVVCVSLPGYIIARLGHFDADKQKFLANLNVMLFTPCLIFTKLASQLNADKLLDLGIIPIIFIIQTFVSYIVSRIVARCCGFNHRASNFVTAMGVFGNSNSLPISLVISLSQTLKGLHWDKIPGDNDDEVAARGILYLLVFQQLGQLVRWSWGYHVLLAPKSKYEEYADETIEEGRYEGEETQGLIEGEEDRLSNDSSLDRPVSPAHTDDSGTHYSPAGRTPVGGSSRASPHDSEDDEHDAVGALKKANNSKANPHGRRQLADQNDNDDDFNRILSFPHIHNALNDETEAPKGIKGVPVRVQRFARKTERRVCTAIKTTARSAYNSLPRPLQTALTGLQRASVRVYGFLWDFMNPPLWAMLIAVFVASVPDLQALFFREGSFIKTSVTSAISSSAGVAVPLILVVLGANLARNTQAREEEMDPEERRIGTRLLVASLLSRMLLPTLIMAPVLAMFAKFVPVSILDDPIFVIVCFLLTGAPSALQLAQICQINNVYESVMGRVLFQSYVIWILPSTLVLVMCALEVVEWAR